MAFIASKLYNNFEVNNLSIACVYDYNLVKIPRQDAQKLPVSDTNIFFQAMKNAA